MPAVLVPELICSDLERSRRLYCDVFGFSVRYARPEERFVYLEREGAELMLIEPLVRERLFPRAELVHPYGRGVNLEIAVTDVEAVHAHVRAAGCEIYLELEERWYGRQIDALQVRQFADEDPDGYLLRSSQTLGTRPL